MVRTRDCGRSSTTVCLCRKNTRKRASTGSSLTSAWTCSDLLERVTHIHTQAWTWITLFSFSSQCVFPEAKGATFKAALCDKHLGKSSNPRLTLNWGTMPALGVLDVKWLPHMDGEECLKKKGRFLVPLSHFQTYCLQYLSVISINLTIMRAWVQLHCLYLS